MSKSPPPDWVVCFEGAPRISTDGLVGSYSRMRFFYHDFKSKADALVYAATQQAPPDGKLWIGRFTAGGRFASKEIVQP